MAELWESSHFGSVDTLRSKIPTFLGHLARENPPVNSTRISDKAMIEARAVPSLVGIARWTMQSTRDAAPMLRDAWPDIWKWIHWVLKRAKEDSAYHLGRRASLWIIHVLGPDKEAREAMSSTKGAMAMVAELWAAEAAALPLAASDYQLAFVPSLPASRALHRFFDHAEPRWYDTIQKSLGDDPVKVGGLVLDTIHGRIREEVVDLTTLRTDLAILVILSGWNITPLRSTLVSRRGAQIINKAIVRLLACDEDEHEMASLCLVMCVDYLVLGLQAEIGRAWAYRMFDAPILRAIVQAGIWKPSEEVVLAKELDQITPYLLYRSVLQRAERACELLDDLDLEDQMDKNGPVYKSLRTYRMRIGERLGVDGRSFGTKLCENASVSVLLFHYSYQTKPSI